MSSLCPATTTSGSEEKSAMFWTLWVRADAALLLRLLAYWRSLSSAAGSALIDMTCNHARSPEAIGHAQRHGPAWSISATKQSEAAGL